jgi:hypothetical protein
MTTPQTHTKGGTTEVWASLGWNRNVIGMIFAQWKGWFLCNSGGRRSAESAHTVIGYHCPSRRPSTDQVGRKLDGGGGYRSVRRGKKTEALGIEPWVGLLSC